jgi:hypothetical protein
MIDREPKSSATKFLDSHPELRRLMRESKNFDEIKLRAAIQFDEVEDECLYIVKGDAFGNEDDLFLDSLAEGSREDSANELNRVLFLELDDAQRALLRKRFGKI